MKKEVMLGLILISVILVSGCTIKEIPPEKYCKTDEDCLTSCGTKIGKGSCYNKNYFEFDEKGMLVNQIDNTCCECDYTECNHCICKNNYCTVKKGEC